MNTASVNIHEARAAAKVLLSEHPDPEYYRALRDFFDATYGKGAWQEVSRYSFHIEFEAENADDALRIGLDTAQVVAESLHNGFGRSVHAWDVSTTDAKGNQDWSVILPRGVRHTTEEHERFEQSHYRPCPIPVRVEYR